MNAPEAVWRHTPRLSRPIYYSLMLFILSVPFDGLDLLGAGNLFTATKFFGILLAITCLLQPFVCFGKPPAPFWCFFGYLIVYTALDSMKMETLRSDWTYITTVAQNLVLFWIVSSIIRHSPQVQRSLLRALMVSIGTMVLLMRFGIATTQVESFGAVRVAGVGMPDFIYAVGMLISLGQAADKRSSLPWRLVGVFVTALCALGCVKSGSRGTMLAVTISITVYGLAMPGFTAKLKRLILAAGVLACFIAIVISTDVARERVYAAIYEGQMARHDTIAKDLLSMFFEKPLFGWGPVIHLRELSIRGDAASEERDTHSDILWALTATGLAGGGFFIAGVLLCLLAAWKGRKSALGPLAFALMTAYFLVSNVTTTHKRKLAWLVMSYSVASASLAAGTPRREGTRPAVGMARRS